MKIAEYNQSFFSVKFENDIFISINCFGNFLQMFGMFSRKVIVRCRNLNYRIEDELLSKFLKINAIQILTYQPSDQIDFIINTEFINSELTQSLYELWISFGQCMIVFQCARTNINVLEFSPEYIVQKTESYVMYKCIEENVIWVQKSRLIDFPKHLF